jgi:sugar phosphate isomerase/epimerase
MTNASRLCVHTITTKPLPLEVALDEYARIGATGVTVWRDAYAGSGPAAARKLISASGLSCVSLCRGGFFVAKDPAEREKSLADNLTLLHEAAELGAPHVVLVCGAAPGVELREARGMIQDAIARLLPTCEKLGVKLAIEPLHPMYADTRSAVNTMTQANDICQALASKHLGVAVDVYHVWWDDRLEAELTRCANLNALLAFHACDYRSPTRDLLNDRGLPGDGVIPVRRLRQLTDAAGFSGHIEVEIFSTEYWAMDQRAFLAKLRQSYLQHC